MVIYEDGEQYELDQEQLKNDLLKEEYDLVTISQVGELVIDVRREGKRTIREVWQARPTGYSGAMNVADMDFEFCRSFLVER